MSLALPDATPRATFWHEGRSLSIGAGGAALRRGAKGVIPADMTVSDDAPDDARAHRAQQFISALPLAMRGQQLLRLVEAQRAGRHAERVAHLSDRHHFVGHPGSSSVRISFSGAICELRERHTIADDAYVSATSRHSNGRE
jgi:hypothetical protein